MLLKIENALRAPRRLGAVLWHLATQHISNLGANQNCLQIFVGGLDPNITEDELKQIFAQFGELAYVKIPPGRGCGFVQYVARCVQNFKSSIYS